MRKARNGVENAKAVSALARLVGDGVDVVVVGAVAVAALVRAAVPRWLTAMSKAVTAASASTRNRAMTERPARESPAGTSAVANNSRTGMTTLMSIMGMRITLMDKVNRQEGASIAVRLATSRRGPRNLGARRNRGDPRSRVGTRNRAVRGSPVGAASHAAGNPAAVVSHTLVASPAAAVIHTVAVSHAVVPSPMVVANHAVAAIRMSRVVGMSRASHSSSALSHTSRRSLANRLRTASVRGSRLRAPKRSSRLSRMWCGRRQRRLAPVETSK